MKCRCGKLIPIYYFVLLCDECCDRQVEHLKLASAHQRLGEVDVKGAPSVAELEALWKL